MHRNKGYDVEEEMMKLFNGKRHGLDCVDFQTDTHIYEVKSCKLIINCTKKKRDKEGKTTQMGRFFIRKYNHDGIKQVSVVENKIPGYIFVLYIGEQKIWKEMSWDSVDSILNKKIEHVPIRIHEIFKKELGLR